MKSILFTIICTVILSACTTNPAVTENQTSVPPQQEIRAESTPTRRSGTFNDLISTGTQQCTYTYSDDNVTSTGKIYLDNGQMRGDTTATMDGKAYNAHILIRDNMMYSWENSQPQGVKMDYTKVQAMAKDFEVQSKENPSMPDLNQKHDYDCTGWTPDAATFAVPSDIEFVDFTKQLEQLNSMQQKLPASTGQDTCGVCEQLTGDQKTQCLQVVKC